MELDESKKTMHRHAESTDGASSAVADGSRRSLYDLIRRRSISVVLQGESAECGLACIAMLAEHLGRPVSLRELRDQFPTTGRGTSLAQIMDVLSALGFATRPVKFELESIEQLRTPCILHWKMKHFVVLESVSRKTLDIIDPKRGRQRVSKIEADEYVTGVALEVEAGARIKRRDRPEAISLRALAGSIDGIGSGITRIICLALFLEILVLLFPQHLRMTVDQVLPFADARLLNFLGFTFVAALGIKAGVEAMRQWMLIWMSSSINLGWTGNVFNQLIRLPLDYFAKRQLGDVVSRFASISAIQQTLTTNFVVVVIDGLTAIISISLLIYYSPRLTLIVCLFASAYAFARFAYLRAYESAVQAQVNVTAIQQGELIESLRAMLTIRLNNKSALRSARFMNATARVVNTSVIFQRLELIFTFIGSLCTGGQRIAVLWVGGAIALSGGLTPGVLIAFVIYSDQFIARFAKLADYVVQFKLLRFHAERLADIVLTAPERFVDGKEGAFLLSTRIAFEDVDFSYGYGAPLILKKCSFIIEPGEVVAITGASGAGKSTIAKILLGVHDHQSGRVSIGGQDIRSLGKRVVRENTACVFQSDQLFAGSLAENISFFDEDASMVEIWRAAELAKIADEIASMPMGMNTPVGDMGSTLSGGQVQRVLLARAFFRRPKMLILDEATSQLDIANEKLIAEAVRSAGLTTLLIAHRPQTVNSADRILVLENGALHEIEKNEGILRDEG